MREKSKSLEVIKENINASPKNYTWLEWDEKQMRGKFTALPPREEIPEKINEQSICRIVFKIDITISCFWRP